MVKSFSGLIICLHTKRKKLMFLSSYTTLEIGEMLPNYYCFPEPIHLAVMPITEFLL